MVKSKKAKSKKQCKDIMLGGMDGWMDGWIDDGWSVSYNMGKDSVSSIRSLNLPNSIQNACN